MNDQTLFEVIERYLLGQLSTKEKVDFEALIANDSQIKAEVEAHKLANKVAAHAWENKMRVEMKKEDTALNEAFDWDAHFDNEEGKENTYQTNGQSLAVRRTIVPMWRKIAIAASFALFAVALTFMFQSPENQGSFADNIELMTEQDVNKRGASDDPNEQAVLLIKGDKALKLKKYKEAAEYYQKVLTVGEPSSFQHQAQYHLAISYHDSGDFSNFETLINEIASDDDHEYQDEAKERLSEYSKR